MSVTEDSPRPEALETPGDGPGTAPVWVVFLASVALAAAFPAVDFAVGLLWRPKRRPLEDAAWGEFLATVGSALLVAVWIYVFWSLIGSFLNVVIHRLPRGESLVLGGSHCPKCGGRILWHDNLPVVGWLRLGGRCRGCRLPIAPRYAFVEAITAGLGTALYFRQVVSGGANLPFRQVDFSPGGLLRLLPDPRIDLVGLYFFHAATICVLLAWGLIAWDRRRASARAGGMVLLVAAAAALVLPSIHPLGPDRPEAAGFLPRLLGAGVGGLAGWAAGGGLQWLLRRLLRGDAAGRTGLPFPPPASLGFGLALVGVVSGWQGMLGTTMLLIVACLVQLLAWSSLPAWPAVPVEILLVPAAFVHLCWWRPLVSALGRWWPAEPTAACLALPAGLLFAVTAALAAITPRTGRRGLPAETPDADA